jgi:hypothetical protein
MNSDPDWDDQDTRMMLTLDNLAKRYKCLPSEVYRRADTLDLYVLDVAAKWAKHQQDKQEGKSPQVKEPTQAEMLAMLNKVRNMESA